ncbi:hypothetical protein DSM3645_05420 [Blastopirellula marina DSM 3645]|uniref:Uncharacterized protein n=1 Tax=Blastopirellula marina DSM 3645 TaxID=314230 RepID=A3ZTX8_9BACT|nr:hypothetical protein DSM3645_05420 [Blastopirellula marina DSM 3645]
MKTRRESYPHPFGKSDPGVASCGILGEWRQESSADFRAKLGIFARK